MRAESERATSTACTRALSEPCAQAVAAQRIRGSTMIERIRMRDEESRFVPRDSSPRMRALRSARGRPAVRLLLQPVCEPLADAAKPVHEQPRLTGARQL